MVRGNIMDNSSPINVGSTRSRKKCEACRVQKVGCQPVDRDWNNGEKCNRCKKFRLPCGQNITAGEQRKGLARSARREGNDQEEDETYLASSQRSLSFNASENGSINVIFNNGDDSISDLNWPPIPTISQETPGEFVAGRRNDLRETESKESEILDSLRSLDLSVRKLLYLQTFWPKSQDANQILLRSMLQMPQEHLERKIELEVDKIESFASEAESNGRRSEAYMAYSRLIERLKQIGDHARRISVLSKLAKFHMRNEDYLVAIETLQELLKQDRASGPDRDNWNTMLVDSYAKSAQGIAGLSSEAEGYPGSEFGIPGFNLETPCPDFHLTIQDKAPAEAMSIILSRQGPDDAVDVFHRSKIHMAIELGRQDIVEELVQKAPITVRMQDLFGRTPLHLVVQYPCEHRTSSQDPRTTICPHALICKILLLAGADRNSRDFAGCTILTSAARAGCPVICKDLLFDGYRTKPAEINPILSCLQSTPLQAAAEEGHGDIVNLFLMAGARASHLRHDSKTAYELAKERGDHDIVRRIEQALREERVVPPDQFNLAAIDRFMSGE